MPLRVAAALKLALIVFLIGTAVTAQAAPHEQFHTHSSHHCCGLCHAGMPFVSPAPTSTVAPGSAHEWLEAAPSTDAPRDAQISSESSRAPPA